MALALLFGVVLVAAAAAAAACMNSTDRWSSAETDLMMPCLLFQSGSLLAVVSSAANMFRALAGNADLLGFRHVAAPALLCFMHHLAHLLLLMPNRCWHHSKQH
jgi:hypothetical protein